MYAPVGAALPLHPRTEPDDAMVRDDDDAVDVVGDDVDNLLTGKKGSLAPRSLRTRIWGEGGGGGGFSHLVVLALRQHGDKRHVPAVEQLFPGVDLLVRGPRALVGRMERPWRPHLQGQHRSVQRHVSSDARVAAPGPAGAERRVWLRTLVVVRPAKPAFPRQRSPTPSKNFPLPAKRPAMGRRNSPRTPLPVP